MIFSREIPFLSKPRQNVRRLWWQVLVVHAVYTGHVPQPEDAMGSKHLPSRMHLNIIKTNFFLLSPRINMITFVLSQDKSFKNFECPKENLYFIVRFKSELEICFQNVFCNLKIFFEPILCMEITNYLFNLRMKVLEINIMTNVSS